MIPGSEEWADRNRALFAILLTVLTALAILLLEQQLESDPAPTRVEVNQEVNVHYETPRGYDDQIERLIEDKLREHQQEPPSTEQPSG